MTAKEAYLFGASNLGKEAYNLLKKNINIAGFFDNDSKKWGHEFLDGKKIMSPNEVTNLDDNSIVLITSSYYTQISSQLTQMGCAFYNYPCLQVCGLDNISDEQLCRHIDKAAARLYTKLMKIDISALPISDYNKKYLDSKTVGDIFTYSLIMYRILSHNPNIKYFLDYGGGTGLLSLLAIECGIENVYYNDIYDASCHDSGIIANEMGYSRLSPICGDIDDVVKFSNDSGVLFDAVGSYDVLEHIYNLKEFYLGLRYILHKDSIVCMESGANSFSPLNDLRLKHLKAEFFESAKVYGHKERDSLKAYYNIRLEIIQKFASQNNINLKEAEIIALAFLTRGKMTPDIIKAVDAYINYNELPCADPFFEFNTCDPLTGNWSEHIIDFNELSGYLYSIGYKCEFAFRGAPDTSPTIQMITQLS